jgi:zinc/manganese transport system substrate-binding protein
MASQPSTSKLQIVAAENFWGSIAGQLGGDKVAVTSLIRNPDTDPHDYEPSPGDGRAVAGARYVIVNGAGYDPGASKLIQSNPSGSRQELDVGGLVGVGDGGNPHLWYDPGYVAAVIDRITADLQRLDPQDRAYFGRQHDWYVSSGLQRYNQLRTEIAQRYANAPVGATESIFAYQARSLGLRLVTPPAFMNAINEGAEPSAEDKATFNSQIDEGQLEVLVFDEQNATPDVRSLVGRARTRKIPVVAITETLQPASATFQSWQVDQLQRLRDALATGSAGR